MVPIPTVPAQQPGVTQPLTGDAAAAPRDHDLYRRPETPVQTFEPADDAGTVPIAAPADERTWPSVSDYWPADIDTYAPDLEARTPDPNAPDPSIPTMVPGIDDPAQTRLWPQRDEGPSDEFFDGARPGGPAPPVPGHRLRLLATRVGLGLTALALIISGSVLVDRAFGSDDREDAVAVAPPDNDSAEQRQSPPGEPGPAPGEQSGPVNGATDAAFDMLGDADGVQIRTADLGDVLYRVSASPEGNVRPDVSADGSDVRMTLEPTGRDEGTTVSVLLNAEIRWRVRVGVGVKQGSLDLSGGRPVKQVELAGTASAFDLTLGQPRGTLSVLVTGGIDRLRVITADAIAVRVLARGGAGTVAVGERTRNGVARDSVILSPGWEQASDRIDLDAVAGIGTLRVEQR